MSQGLTCPHCNKPLQIGMTVIKAEDSCAVLYITRLAMTEDKAKPKQYRKYVDLGYEADKDRYKVMLTTE